MGFTLSIPAESATTSTLTVRLVSPPAEAATSVYVVVSSGFTRKVPVSALAPNPGSMRTPVAFDTDQRSKADSPFVIADGDALNVALAAGTGAAASIVTSFGKLPHRVHFADSVKRVVWVGARIRFPFNPTLPISGAI